MSDDEIPEPDRIEGAPHPRETQNLIGQEAAEAAFLSAFNSKRLHHGWLITGPRGVGKATLAWRIARFLLAAPADDSGMFGDALPVPETLNIPVDHPVNRRITALSEPGLFLLRPAWDEKKKRLKANITVDEARKLKGFFQLSSTDGGRRVVIVDSADELNVNAANALLKLLEEPPDRTTLILASASSAPLAATNRSRCQKRWGFGTRSIGSCDTSCSRNRARQPEVESARLLGLRSVQVVVQCPTRSNFTPTLDIHLHANDTAVRDAGDPAFGDELRKIRDTRVVPHQNHFVVAIVHPFECIE
jgi:hypothetical protein